MCIVEEKSGYTVLPRLCCVQRVVLKFTLVFKCAAFPENNPDSMLHAELSQ